MYNNKCSTRRYFHYINVFVLFALETMRSDKPYSITFLFLHVVPSSMYPTTRRCGLISRLPTCRTAEDTCNSRVHPCNNYVASHKKFSLRWKYNTKKCSDVNFKSINTISQITLKINNVFFIKLWTQHTLVRVNLIIEEK